MVKSYCASTAIDPVALWAQRPSHKMTSGCTNASFHSLFRVEVVDRQSFPGFPNLLFGFLVLLAFHGMGLHTKRSTEHKNLVGWADNDCSFLAVRSDFGSRRPVG